MRILWRNTQRSRLGRGWRVRSESLSTPYWSALTSFSYRFQFPVHALTERDSFRLEGEGKRPAMAGGRTTDCSTDGGSEQEITTLFPPIFRRFLDPLRRCRTAGFYDLLPATSGTPTDSRGTMRLLLFFRRGDSSGKKGEKLKSRSVFLRHRDEAADDERG
jgi:hypothetical protein